MSLAIALTTTSGPTAAEPPVLGAHEAQAVAEEAYMYGLPPVYDELRELDTH